MEPKELLKNFEKACHKYCENTGLRVLSFDFKNDVRISFHVYTGLILYTIENDWNIGNPEDHPKYGETCEGVIKALITAINSSLIDTCEIEKHIMSIT
jgi:hypothetical protein